jgi:hypothetical protein
MCGPSPLTAKPAVCFLAAYAKPPLIYGKIYKKCRRPYDGRGMIRKKTRKKAAGQSMTRGILYQ